MDALEREQSQVDESAAVLEKKLRLVMDKGTSFCSLLDLYAFQKVYCLEHFLEALWVCNSGDITGEKKFGTANHRCGKLSPLNYRTFF